MNTASLTELLHTQGMRATPARLALLAVLSRAKQPMSISALESALAKEKINKVTFYRMVDDLVAAKLVRPVDLRHGHAHYELVPREEHHHLTCVRCGKIVDIQACLPKKFSTNALNDHPEFASIIDHSLELFGVCKKCASK